MAKFYGSNAAQWQNTVPVTKIQSGQDGGKLAVFLDKFLVPSVAPVNNDLIYLMTIPDQFLVTDFVLTNVVITGTSSVDFGWLAGVKSDGSAGTAAVDDGFASALDLSTVVKYTMSTQTSVAAGMFKQFTGRTQVLATIDTTWTGTTATMGFTCALYGIEGGY